MKKRILWVIPFLLIGCGGPVTESATRSDALAGDKGQRQWTLIRWDFGPGDFVFNLGDCLPGETLTFVGTVWFKDHDAYSPGSGVTHENWDIWYDPPEYVSLTTGQKWAFGPGSNNHGAWQLDGSGNKIAGVNHDFIKLSDETTGQVIRAVYKWQVTVNAFGEYKRDYMYLSCPMN